MVLMDPVLLLILSMMGIPMMNVLTMNKLLNGVLYKIMFKEPKENQTSKKRIECTVQRKLNYEKQIILSDIEH